MNPGYEPVDENEVVYRRVRLDHHDPKVGPHPSPEAFRPNDNDKDGLSLRRARYFTPEQAARGRPEKQYWTAHLRVSDLLGLGVSLSPDREGELDAEAGHCVIRELVYSTRRSDKSVFLQYQLARAVVKVDGPYKS